MTVAWVNLSTRWGLTSVQAALNLIISVLGTVGVWAFSRHCWQRGSTSVLYQNSEVPLPSLVTVSSLGEAWETVTVLRQRIFQRNNRSLLVQLFVVAIATIACMFAGPIAKLSLRSTSTIQNSHLEVLQSIKGDSYTANLVDANVLWNDTIESLNKAGYPDTQMLDFLPPSVAPWVYIANEWNPTWTMTCNSTHETILHDVTATGNHTFYQPIDAFPAYRDTYEPSWLNTSKFRIQSDFACWSIANTHIYRDALFFTLIQTDPGINNRLYNDNGTLQMSLSVLHAKEFNTTDYSDVTLGTNTQWKPFGPVGNASFSRIECNFTRKANVANENEIPWLWTNDTYSITYGYSTFWYYLLENDSSKDLRVPTPTPKRILRFYQAYYISVNTIYAFPSLRKLSVMVDTVQLSVTFLVIAIILAALTLWTTARYFIFLFRHHARLAESYVPDGKLEWMIYGVKIVASSSRSDKELKNGKRLQDRDHLQMATFGRPPPPSQDSESVNSDTGQQRSRIARIQTQRISRPGRSASRSCSRVSVSNCPSGINVPAIVLHDDEDNSHNLKRIASSVHSNGSLNINSPVDGSSRQSSQQPSPNPRTRTPRSSLADGSRPKDIDEITPCDG